MPYLKLRSLSLLSDSEVEVILDDSEGGDVRYRFVLDRSHDIHVLNSEYGMSAGAATPLWPSRLAWAALTAYGSSLPTGEALERIRARHRHWLRERWESKADRM